MSIKFYNEDVNFPKLNRRKASRWIKTVIDSEGKKSGEIVFIFCSDAYLLEINKKFLNHDYFTDIVTFDYVIGDAISGDIFISIERVAENSIEFRTTFENELNRILVHGILHLIGYKDKTKNEKLVMTAKENYYLKVLLDN